VKAGVLLSAEGLQPDCARVTAYPEVMNMTWHI